MRHSNSADFRFGSKADIALGPRHVRFTPKSGQRGVDVRFVPKADIREV
jgi:hypothetical protein